MRHRRLLGRDTQRQEEGEEDEARLDQVRGRPGPHQGHTRWYLHKNVHVCCLLLGKRDRCQWEIYSPTFQLNHGTRVEENKRFRVAEWDGEGKGRWDMTPSYQFVLPEAVIRRYLYTVGVDPAPPPEREGLDKETLPGQIVKYWWGRNKEIGVVCLECHRIVF
ncbi:hypothetical protein RRG08_014678 [Elysia crispata]|uniref:Uncharacterized protein n=1 Tax=Elysia crispata TaxID=231223 RepID=A0AAE0YIQ3_9GAST|nr:hypothetical protein RRG08_014678 [Elysia crispata]